ncbi:hypothetical protein DFI02_1044 [Rhizobium sp. PP-F2F-G20b]|nr:hypothetical protein C8J32_11915 [Rhizobium sp. PP-CC-3A-592]PYE43300.1 hypothetical protein DFI02_1044 [Rhizobium sp. PP-F2F-G20b]
MPELSCILLAGPNGSGKSSAFAKLDLEGVWINADEIAKSIPSDHDGRSTGHRNVNPSAIALCDFAA